MEINRQAVEQAVAQELPERQGQPVAAQPELPAEQAQPEQRAGLEQPELPAVGQRAVPVAAQAAHKTIFNEHT